MRPSASVAATASPTAASRSAWNCSDSELARRCEMSRIVANTTPGGGTRGQPCRGLLEPVHRTVQVECTELDVDPISGLFQLRDRREEPLAIVGMDQVEAVATHQLVGLATEHAGAVRADPDDRGRPRRRTSRRRSRGATSASTRSCSAIGPGFRRSTPLVPDPAAPHGGDERRRARGRRAARTHARPRRSQRARRAPAPRPRRRARGRAAPWRARRSRSVRQRRRGSQGCVRCWIRELLRRRSRSGSRRATRRRRAARVRSGGASGRWAAMTRTRSGRRVRRTRRVRVRASSSSVIGLPSRS